MSAPVDGAPAVADPAASAIAAAMVAVVTRRSLKSPACGSLSRACPSLPRAGPRHGKPEGSTIARRARTGRYVRSLCVTYYQARKKVTLALGNNQLTVTMARTAMAFIDLREEAGLDLPATWDGLLEVALGRREARDDDLD